MMKTVRQYSNVKASPGFASSTFGRAAGSFRETSSEPGRWEPVPVETA